MKLKVRSIYVNGCPCWECPRCGGRWNVDPEGQAAAFEHERRADCVRRVW